MADESRTVNSQGGNPVKDKTNNLDLNGTSTNRGSQVPDGSKTFYTVQSEADILRLKNGGAPWPKEANRAALGEGVYSWSTRAEAENYLRIIGEKNPTAKILEFSVSNKNLSKFKTMNIDRLTDAEAEKFMGQYSRLWGVLPIMGMNISKEAQILGWNISLATLFSNI